ncbi:tetratricopeptide repeat protein [Lentzea sp. NPDC059081]|uniref:tetratricopeptide repeat protein n=1 Tax=Lentzea sp. NPDC059081 TaxID=3346719 RepID=UPI0036948AE6
MEATEEALRIWRQLDEIEPGQRRLDLAYSLHNLGVILAELGRHREALEVTREAVEIRRHMAETEPNLQRPYLAISLHSLGTLLHETDDVNSALNVFREALAEWRACIEQDPQLYAAPYRRELAHLRKQLELQGRHDEAAALDLGAPDASDQDAE